MDDQSVDITRLLGEWRAGDREAANRLFRLVYRELHALAHRQLARRVPGDSLVTTALVHEAYLKLVDRRRASFNDRGHFFAVAARAMRQILVDQARKRSSQKRGGGLHRIDLDEQKVPLAERAAEVVALDEALTRLEVIEPRLGRVVELRYFGGLSVEETAEALDLSPPTVKRDWRKARLLLHRELTREDAP
ncbi:MAG: sigma-70 family RNA polymerase sigma factor [Thermoleophilia bacterium]|nr:sigma-70 family RNA polymerase sigma factor [Thermoleophilia bacterium]